MNNIPAIESKLKNQRDKLVGLTGFLGVGLGVASITTLGLSGLTLLSPLVVLGFESYYFNKMIKDNQEYKRNAGLFTRPFLKKSLKNWIKDYIEEAPTDVEKKYKSLFLGLWLNQRKLSFGTLLEYDKQYLEELNDRLINQGVTNFSILDITRENKYSGNFNKVTHHISKTMNVEKISSHATLEDFVKEDIKNITNISVGKKVYQEYSKQGLASKFLTNNLDNFLSCMFFQDYKLSDVDYKNIKEITDKSSKNNKIWMKSYQSLKEHFYFFDDNKISLFELIIDNEQKEENLNILRSFLKLHSEGSDEFIFSKSKKAPNPIGYLIDFIDTKKNYLSLSDKLEKNESNPIKKIRKKI